MSNPRPSTAQPPEHPEDAFLELHDPKFWVVFDGAYRSLLAALQQHTGGLPGAGHRGAMKIRTRDAEILAHGIAGLLMAFQHANAVAKFGTDGRANESRSGHGHRPSSHSPAA